MSPGLAISSPSDNYEQEAEETASRTMAGTGDATEAIQRTATMTPTSSSSGIAIQRFQAGETGHGGIEERALTGESTGLPKELQFTPDEVSKIYIGNWLRDLSQLPPSAFQLVNMLALGEFGREIFPF